MNCFGESDIVGAEAMDHHHSSGGSGTNGYNVATTDNHGSVVVGNGVVAVGPQYTSVIVEPTSFQMNNEYVH